jgi:prevent-host-death family protein
MKTISHRELRNDSSAVLRDVANGESYTVTNRGEVVGALVPVSQASDLTCVRPARKRPAFSAMTRHVIAETSEEALDDLRGER